MSTNKIDFDSFKLSQKEKINLNDWRFWFKFLLGLSIFFVIIIPTIVLLVEIVNLNKIINEEIKKYIAAKQSLNELVQTFEEKYYSNDAFKYLHISLSRDVDGNIVNASCESRIWLWYTWYYANYFTQLSNLLVATWLIIAAFNPKKEGVKGLLSLTPTMVTVCFITVTMFIAVFFLGPMLAVINYNKITSVEETNKSIINFKNAETFFNTFWLHLVTPILFNFYIFKFYPKEEFNVEVNYFKKNLIIGLPILCLYGVYSIIKGEIFILWDVPEELQYPYFFFRIHETITGIPGYIWTIIGGLLILGVFTGWSALVDENFKKKHNRENN